MAARKAAAAESEPRKIDSALPDPAVQVEAGVVRAKASRPTFRRGGLVFSDRDWTVIDPEIGPEAQLAIVSDPVLTLQIRGPGGEWLTLSAEQRAEAIAAAENETSQAQA